MSDANFAGKTALITGASRGIGRALALALAERGAHLIAVGRSQASLEALDDAIRARGGSATLAPLDLANLQAVGQLCQSILERFEGKLDILVGNAALLGPLGPISSIQANDWNQHLSVNVSANLVLMQGLEAALRVSEAGRALFVTSPQAHSPFAFWGAYGATKAALETLVSAWAKEQKGTGLQVNLFDPGMTATDMYTLAFPGKKTDDVKTPDTLVPAFLELLHPDSTRHAERFEAEAWLASQKTS